MPSLRLSPPQHVESRAWSVHGLADLRCACVRHPTTAGWCSGLRNPCQHSQGRYLRARRFWGAASLPGSVRAGLGPISLQGERHSVLGDSVFAGRRGRCPPCWWTPMTWLCVCCACDGAVQASTMRLELQNHMRCISIIYLICNPLVCSGVVRVPIFPQQML